MTRFDTSSYAKKIDLANLKSDADKSDIDKVKKLPNGLSNLKSKGEEFNVDKLLPVPIDLSNLSDEW